MELSATRTGSGRALVLIHGITENRATWDPLIESLSDTFDVLAVDLRAHGASAKGDTSDMLGMAADVRDTVTAMGLMNGSDGPGPLVIGHSLGGIVATFYAASFPTRGAVNVDQSLRLSGFKEGLTMLAPMLRGDEASFRQALDIVFSSLAGALSPAAAERIQAIRRPDQEVVLGIWSTVLDTDIAELETMIRDLLRGVTVPYLAIHGSERDAEYESWLEARLPSATIEWWPGLGHYPHLVEPERFVARVRAFDATL